MDEQDVPSDHDPQGEPGEDVRARHIRRRDRGSDQTAAAPPGSGTVEHRNRSLEERRRIDPESHAGDTTSAESQPTLTPELDLTYSEMTQGIIPPPMMLNGYREISPRYADAIIEMAVEDAKSRTEVRRRTAKAEARVVTMGAIVPLVAVVLGLLFGFIAILQGHEFGGALIGFAPASLVGIAKIIQAARGDSE